jgi:hypothetical protein
VAQGVAYLAKADASLRDEVTEAALRHAKAEVFRCKELHEVRQHEDAARTVTLVVKNSIRATDISTIEVETGDEALQRDFVNAVLAEMKPTKPHRGSSLQTELIGPLIVGVFVAILGALIITAALDTGGPQQPSSRVGKAGGIEKIVDGIAGALGPTGSLVLFAVLLSLCVAWAVSVFKARHMVVRWRLK